MTGPRIIIPKSVKHDHDELRELIDFAMIVTDSCEVHVKARNVRYRHEVSRIVDGRRIVSGGQRKVLVQRFGAEHVKRFTNWGPYWCSARAYSHVPDMARVAPGTRWLVTMTVPNPAAYACNTFPYDHVYPGKRKSSAAWPHIDFHEWRDDVIRTAAHEARHVQQFIGGLPLSEMDAERHARERLQVWRSLGDDLP